MHRVLLPIMNKNVEMNSLGDNVKVAELNWYVRLPFHTLSKAVILSPNPGERQYRNTYQRGQT